MNKETAKRTFPIKARVFRRRDFTEPVQKAACLSSGLKDALASKDPAIGYAHIKFHDYDQKADGTHRLSINIGISFCDPNEWHSFDPSTGKYLAKSYAEDTLQHRFMCCDYQSVEYQKNDVCPYYKGAKRLVPTCDLKKEIMPPARPVYYFLGLKEDIRAEFAERFDVVELCLNYNMRTAYFDNRFVKGKDHVYFFESSIYNQLKAYLNVACLNYLMKRFKVTLYPMKPADDKEWQLDVKRSMEEAEKHYLVTCKNDCIIVPVKTNVYVLDASKYCKKHGPVAHIVNDVPVGYIAIKVRDGHFYIGASYCNPEDVLHHRNKYGKRLAYKRMMIHLEQGDHDFVPVYAQELAKEENGYHYYFDKETFTSYEYLGWEDMLYHRLQVNLNKYFSAEIRDKVLEKLFVKEEIPTAIVGHYKFKPKKGAK